MRLSSTRRRRYRYDYYTIALPSDLVDPMPWHWFSLMCDHAIAQAKDQTKIYCVPCEWQAWLIRGHQSSVESVFKVRRKRFISQETGDSK